MVDKEKDTLSEFEKMRSGKLYRFNDEEVLASARHANELCAKLSTMTLYSPDYRSTIEDLIPGIPCTSAVNTPVRCDHGSGIKIGENTFVNYDCIFLDGAYVTIGSRCKIGPQCKFFTPQHPIDYELRREPVETCFPITIGDDCWLGGGVTVCPGVTIGPRCVIAAGSVVTKDIPADSLAAGNPAVVKRNLKNLNNLIFITR